MEAAREAYATDLAYEHDLTVPQGRQLAELVIHFLDPSSFPHVADHLGDPAVAEAFVSASLCVDTDTAAAERVERIASSAIAQGRAAAGGWFVCASVAERRGDTRTQRRCLDASLAIDPAFWPSLGAAGFMAFVEGDVRRATTLLRSSRAANAQAMLHTLTHYPTLRSPVSRNHPCPCGSGAKHKHCCAGTLQHPLADRAVWLWEKAAHWLRRPAQVDALLDVAADLGDVDDPTVQSTEMDAAIRSPILDSVALLERGLLRRFLARLGHLLPPDERSLAEGWTAVHHTVWEVEATSPGSSLRLRDLATGTAVEAVNGSVSRCTRPGEIVFAAVVPSGGGWFLPVHPVCLDGAEAGVILDDLTCREPFEVAARVHRFDRQWRET